MSAAATTERAALPRSPSLPTFFDNLDSFAEAPKGVAKLRKLILQIAVTGRLSITNQDDAPVDVELLAEQKAPKGQARGRTGASLGEVTDDEVSNAIPETWVWTRLFRLCAPDAPIVYGILQPGPDIRPDGIPYVRPTEIKNGTINQLEVRHTTSEIADKYQRSTIVEGDILLTIVGTLGATAIVPSVLDGGNITQSSCRLRPNLQLIDREFLVICLQAPCLLTQYTKFSLGSAVRRLNIAHVRALAIPLPPLSEQCRIVSKVDSLMSLCDDLEKQQAERRKVHFRLNMAALGRLTTAKSADELAAAWDRARTNFDLLYSVPETVAALRQAILKLAVQGKLVPQDPNDEPASAVLKRLGATRERLVKKKQLKKSMSLAAVADEELSYQLPDAWAATRLGEVASISTGYAFKSPEYAPTGIFVLRVTNITPDGTIVPDEAVFMPAEKITPRIANYYLVVGDILVVMVGGSLGKIGVVTEDLLPALLNQNMWRLRPICDDYDCAFLRLTLEYINRFQLNITPSTHGHMSMAEYKTQPIGLPPLAEQKRIVARMDALMALCSDLEVKLTQQQTDADRLAEAMTAAILKAEPAPKSPGAKTFKVKKKRRQSATANLP